MGVQPENFSSYNFQHENYLRSLWILPQQAVSLLRALISIKNAEAVPVIRTLVLALAMKISMKILTKIAKALTVTRTLPSVLIIAKAGKGLLLEALGEQFSTARMELTANRKMTLEDRREALTLIKNAEAVTVIRTLVLALAMKISMQILTKIVKALTVTKTLTSVLIIAKAGKGLLLQALGEKFRTARREITVNRTIRLEERKEAFLTFFNNAKAVIVGRTLVLPLAMKILTKNVKAVNVSRT